MADDREFPARTRGAGLIAAGFLYDMPRYRTRQHELGLADGRHRPPAFPACRPSRITGGARSRRSSIRPAWSAPVEPARQSDALPLAEAA